ncbi:MAG: DUF4118 domain-containing protein [Gammaproteobacteria bacterium]|nr:DUF4118 domain-containing protein [Gammaproteobacteria bacterium]
MVATGRELSVATSLSLYLLVLVGVTAVGGLLPGLLTAFITPFAVNWFLIEPYHTLRSRDRDNLIELSVFVSIATIVSMFVSIAARRAAEASQAAREASTLAALAEAGFGEPLEDIVALLRETFGFEGVSLLRETVDGFEVVASAGNKAPTTPEGATLADHLGQKVVLVANGAELGSRDKRVLNAFLGQLAKSLEQQRLQRVALEAESLARTDELRTAILRAVSHDLRSPLASIKASVSSLRQDDIEWPVDIESDFLESIENQTDRLTSIVMNLLDLSRIEAGVLRPTMRPTSIDEVVAAALRNIDADTSRVRVDPSPETPEVVADPALLERAVANLLLNAINWSATFSVRAAFNTADSAARLNFLNSAPAADGLDRSPPPAGVFLRLAPTENGGSVCQMTSAA